MWNIWKTSQKYPENSTWVDLKFWTCILLQPPKKKGKKKVAAAPLKAKKAVEPKKVVNPLFEKRPKNFGIGKRY